ncbi:uncharacterized protein [Typha latifolia]|uniref:uncharacterized protein n=1 Tax=Typha latifolia TaxID=4733 RepID=UPI003C307AD2
MVLLFLHKPETVSGDVNAVKERISLLQKVESLIWSVIKSGGRYEARLWLCNTISCIHSITPRDQRELFIDLLESKSSKKDVSVHLLQMIIEKRREKVGAIIAKKCYLLEKFFEGNTRRIMQWFDNFAAPGESGHKKGARAISQFAFVNRDICWEELVWKGKHGQSPAVVATKPHYFYDLDVLQTVENFLEYVPDFWSSDELAESVKDGEILRIDTKYFVDQFVRLMYEEKCEDIWVIIKDFLMEEKFSSLSQHLLILLDEQRLLSFLKSLTECIRPNSQCEEYRFSCCWLEILLSTHNGCTSVDELLLLNAIIAKGRQLLRLMSDEEHEEEKGIIEELLRSAMDFSDSDHWALMKECVEMKKLEAIKCIGLQSWILYYHLSKDYKTLELCESLFAENRIGFRMVDDYTIIQSGGHSDTDNEGLTRSIHRKRKRDRKKKRKKYDHDEGGPDQLVDFESSNGSRGLQPRGRSWRLSTDGFSSVWNIADIPEHLSIHCFRTWMKWVCLQ